MQLVFLRQLAIAYPKIFAEHSMSRFVRLNFTMTCRFLFLIGCALCTALLAVAFYFQYVAGLNPCPLCIFQRVAFIAAGIILLLGFLHDSQSWGRRIYALLTMLAALFGVVVAGRHVWLQNLPEDAVPQCGPGLEFMLEAFPLPEALGLILQGSGECAEVQWRLLGLTMPAWSLVWLSLLALFALFIALRHTK